jgi:glycosyltransferase involved in cell wall biosynthesis
MNTLPDGPVSAYDIDLGHALPRLERVGDADVVRVLVRVHSRPIAHIEVVVPPEGLSPERVREALVDALPAAAAHLVVDTPSAVPSPIGSSPSDLAEPTWLSKRRKIVNDGPAMTILISTRDRPDSLLRCLGSIADLEYKNFDVVVVDNAPSTDATRRAVAEWREAHDDVRIRYLLEPRPGAALAHNRGLKEVTGSWVVRTDDDVVVDPCWLTAIAEAIADEPGVGCVTGLILPAEVTTPAQKLLEEFGGYSRGFERRCYDLNGHRPVGDRLFPFTVGRLGSGANMAFDVTLLRARGGFDSALGPGTVSRGGEDLFALFQVITEGSQVVYEPGAVVWHWHQGDYASLRRLMHHYGIGLAAYLTSAVVHEPHQLATMLRRVVPAVRHSLGRSSEKNRHKKADYPRELEMMELLGMMRGPLAYARSCRTQRAARS